MNLKKQIEEIIEIFKEHKKHTKLMEDLFFMDKVEYDLNKLKVTELDEEKKKEYKLEYNKKLRTICIRFKDKLFYPQESCYHKTLHIEGKYLKFLICNGCGKRWEREVEYFKNTRYTFFKATSNIYKEER